MKATGRHLLVEYQGCDQAVLNDPQRIETLMLEAARGAGATIVASVFHPFCPQGVSGVVVVAESHLSIHTWPEYGYAAVDFFTCGNCEPERANEILRAGLDAERSETMSVLRGQLDETQSMRVVRHRQDLAKGTTVLLSEEPRHPAVARGLEGVFELQS